ncbi:hypothetical protein Nepgr_001472 [Nepenthes gracilis]|uniref:Uncharacterized protein n=1 Tax=Nepenthes gracilis TaxID=150966 RepID=A0AAD3P774_NEPGR|nr:hypothetical protein Nepgr_001472 [Nepenthes gracilis]
MVTFTPPYEIIRYQPMKEHLMPPFEEYHMPLELPSTTKNPQVFNGRSNTTEVAGEDAIPSQIKTRFGIQEPQNFDKGIPSPNSEGIKGLDHEELPMHIKAFDPMLEHLTVKPLLLREAPSAKGNHNKDGPKSTHGQPIRTMNKIEIDMSNELGGKISSKPLKKPKQREVSGIIVVLFYNQNSYSSCSDRILSKMWLDVNLLRIVPGEKRKESCLSVSLGEVVLIHYVINFTMLCNACFWT